MFDSVLIANRGEIACRIMATARRMGMRTIAVYSDADSNSRHVRLADAAYRIGPAPAAESYLNIEAILKAAELSGADAIHPGYGFLSENFKFAECCLKKGFAFVGPSPEAIGVMGQKDEAKKLMSGAGVPIVPGCNDLEIDLKVLMSEARKVGYPVLIKAAAGGGGRGMRAVSREVDLTDALQAAKREAESAFGNGRLLLEKLIMNPRHIEVQVFADSHGNVVHMFERDCSVQRRHQKVIEEAPGPSIDDTLRLEIAEAAVKAAKAMDYLGAGTVEFVVDNSGQFYFLEMNTRIQVEHRVTEMLTREDLVEWQFRVAYGEPLPARQEEIGCSGHAIEARLYAENPSRKFMPSPGFVKHLRLPSESSDVCVDSALIEGEEVSAYYDPMIAKIVVWGRNRENALRRLKESLGCVQVVGVHTNLSLLQEMVNHQVFKGGDYNTGFIEEYWDDFSLSKKSASNLVVSVAALFVILERERKVKGLATNSPWDSSDAWRLNMSAREVLLFEENESEIEVELIATGEDYRIRFSSGEVLGRANLSGDKEINAVLDGVRVKGTVVCLGNDLFVWLYGAVYQLGLVTKMSPQNGFGSSDIPASNLVSPMPGRVVRLGAKEGESVAKGSVLLVIEAMKMEHSLVAPAHGRVEKFMARVGDWVEEATLLVDFSADS